MFYGLFSSHIQEDFFIVGKLYRLKPPKKKAEENNPFPPTLPTTLFFKINLDTMFRCAISVVTSHPLIYLGVQENWGAKFHVFLYGDMKIFTLGPLNSCPSMYWEEAKSL